MALHPKTWILAQYGGCELSVLGQVFQDSRSSVPGILVKCARFCSRQCLARRIPDKTTLATEVAAWKTTRNDVRSGCRWQFATADARTKLSHLYPKIERSSRLVSFLSIIEKLSTSQKIRYLASSQWNPRRSRGARSIIMGKRRDKKPSQWNPRRSRGASRDCCADGNCYLWSQWNPRRSRGASCYINCK